MNTGKSPGQRVIQFIGTPESSGRPPARGARATRMLGDEALSLALHQFRYAAASIVIAWTLSRLN